MDRKLRKKTRKALENSECFFAIGEDKSGMFFMSDIDEQQFAGILGELMLQNPQLNRMVRETVKVVDQYREITEPFLSNIHTEA